MDTIDEVLTKYLDKGFGSMNKNDFEVWIFSRLMNTVLKGKDNYYASIYLKIPESKVKRLRYEASLKYSSFSKDDLYDAVNKRLKKARFKKGGPFIQFVMEDVALRKYMDSLLKQDGRFSDSSFNSEIVVIDYDDLEYLLGLSEKGRENIDSILSKAKEKLNDKSISFPSLLSSIANKMTEAAADIICEKFIDLSIPGILNLLNGF